MRKKQTKEARILLNIFKAQGVIDQYNILYESIKKAEKPMKKQQLIRESGLLGQTRTTSTEHSASNFGRERHKKSDISIPRSLDAIKSEVGPRQTV